MPTSARARPGPKRKPSTDPVRVVTVHLHAGLFDELRDAIDVTGETQREFLNAAVRRELNRRNRRDRANRKGAANGGKADSESQG